MIRIEIPSVENIPELTAIAIETFIQSHGHSASKEDVDNYLQEHYTGEIFKSEIDNVDNNYRVIFFEDEMVGYSKILFHKPISESEPTNICKLERIYMLEKFHGKGLGEELFNFNIELAKAAGQIGVWLFTWVENKRAIRFYEKMGFEIVGSHDFRISATHTNPNHQMYLAF